MAYLLAFYKYGSFCHNGAEPRKLSDDFSVTCRWPHSQVLVGRLLTRHVWTVKCLHRKLVGSWELEGTDLTTWRYFAHVKPSGWWWFIYYLHSTTVLAMCIKGVLIVWLCAWPVILIFCICFNCIMRGCVNTRAIEFAGGWMLAQKIRFERANLGTYAVRVVPKICIT